MELVHLIDKITGRFMKKEQRIQKLKEIISRWGKLDKEKIFTMFTSSTGKELDSALKRALYRDLTELVNRAELSVEYYTRDGALIEDFDEEIHKNYLCKWYIAESEGKILGEGILNSVNASLYCPKVLADDIAISTGEDTSSFRSTSLFFNIGGKFLSIKINKEAFPVSFLISRTKDKIDEKEIEEIKEKFGCRCIIFKIPLPKVSSYSKDRPGHCLIEFNENNVDIKDFDSTNGTYVFKLSNAEVEKYRHLWAESIKGTVEVSWDELITEDFEEIKNENIDYPLAIKVSEQFKFICS